MLTHFISARGVVTTTRSALVFALVASATTAARAQNAQPAPLPAPVESVVEAGIGDVTDASYKAAEYNGLQSKGAFFIGNVDLRDRAAYDSSSAFRYSINGRDLGLDTRSAFADVAVQGRVRFIIGFDRIRRNRSDSYQTPYFGDGTSALTLPAGWLVPVIASPAGTTLSARGLV